MSDEREYRVTWTMEVQAYSPEDAVAFARDNQSEALIYEALDIQAGTTTVVVAS